jgi:hypothetical protein
MLSRDRTESEKPSTTGSQTKSTPSGEFMRQYKLDGLVDGITNNHMACREIFDVAGRRTAILGRETLPQ